MASIEELDIVIRRRTSGKIVASIPQLSLYAVGNDTYSALSSLDDKKKRLLDDMKEADIPDEFDYLPSATTPAGTRMVTQPGSLSQFALKALILVALIFLVLLVPAGLLAEKARKDMASLSFGGRQFWTKLETQLSRGADPSSDLPEAKKQQILADLRVVVDRWRPYAAELGRFISDLRGDNAQARTSCN